MGFKDYRKFSKKEQENKEQEVQNNEDVNVNVDEITTDNVDVTVDENVEKVKADVTTKGVVTAAKLNVRKEADKESEVLTVISKGTGLGINLTKSTDEFYCVNVLINNEMVTAYCMKEFVLVNE